MKQTQNDFRVCDGTGCQEIADTVFLKISVNKNTPLALCKKCKKELYERLAKDIIPKPVENKFNQKI